MNEERIMTTKAKSKLAELIEAEQELREMPNAKSPIWRKRHRSISLRRRS
jgi:hypothetical protein